MFNQRISDLEAAKASWAQDNGAVTDQEDFSIEDFEQREQDHDAAETRHCLCRSFCQKPNLGCLFRNLLLLGVLAGGAILVLMIYTGGADPRVFFVQEDPPGYAEANRWSNTGTPGRLELNIINSCEDRWTLTFDRYVQEWNNGSPDVLQLTSSRLPHDVECTEYRGQMNVCNGDYGNTDWRGINIVLLYRGSIISSVAKLNDFHLDRESDAQKLYTMCHEIGEFTKRLD